jgi:hypothetical protein
LSTGRASTGNPSIDDALIELEEMIRDRYPRVSFDITHGDDPEGIYLTAVVDIEDIEQVFDVVIDRLLSMQIEEGLPVYVVAVRPPERALEDLRSYRGGRARVSGALL